MKKWINITNLGRHWNNCEYLKKEESIIEIQLTYTCGKFDECMLQFYWRMAYVRRRILCDKE